MMVYRTFNPALVDRIINHPEVRPNFQPGMERLRSAEVLADRRNIVLMTTMGIYGFIAKGDDVYTGCAAQLPQARGKLAFQEGIAARDKMFNDYGARRLEAAAPLWLPGSRVFVRRMGFTPYAIDDKFEYLSVEA